MSDFNSQPKIIFLDAVGTLFGVKNSVGWAYSNIANNYGVMSNSQLVNDAFYDCFKKSEPLAFHENDEAKIRQLEYDWWKKIAFDTFTQVDLIDNFTDFDCFFEELYQYFSTDKPWYIYPDVIPSLNAWQSAGITLSIISNFDTRIYQVLDSLNLSSYFSTITISSLTGFAKPDPNIFLTALVKHNCLPENAWYIGDSEKEDYFGAKNVGMKSFWLSRK